MLAFLVVFCILSTDAKNKKKPGNPTPSTLEVNAEDEHIEYMKEWDSVMQDFSPEDMVSIEIPPRSEEEFYTVIEIVPTVIRGYWFLSSGSNKDIDFSVLNPQQIVIYEKKSVKEAIFSLPVTKQGIYSFILKNTKMIATHTVTLAYHSGNSTNSVLKNEHLTPIEQDLLWVEKAVKDFQVDSQFAQLRQETHYSTVAGANKNVFWFSLLESLGVILVTVWQIYYIKKLLDNRRVL